MRVFLPQIVRALPSTQCGIVMVESLEKGMRRPYHKKKLALLLSNERHLALEQAARGVLSARAAEAVDELASVPRPQYEATNTEKT